MAPRADAHDAPRVHRVTSRAAWRAYLHPTCLLALAVLALNDHWLKGAGIIPGVLTGKLSDVAGLFFFPLLINVPLAMLAALIVRPRARREDALRVLRVLLAVCCAATALGFALIQLSTSAADLYVRALSTLPIYANTPPHLTMDPGDLWTLPSAWLAYLLGARMIASEASRARGRAVGLE